MPWHRISDYGPSQRTRRRRLHLVSVYGALSVVLGVVIVTAIPRNRLPAVDRRATAHVTAAAPAAARAAPPTTTTDPDRGMPPLLPTAAAPLRVLEIGDSLGIDLGDQLQSHLDAAGPSRTTMAALGDTGLANVSYYDWPAQLASLLASVQPQILVVFIGANDDQGILVNGAPLAPGTAAWAAGYRQRVDSILREATSAGVRVVWVGLPPMANSALNAAVQGENQIYQQEMASFPGTLYVSSDGVLGNARGQYESTGVDGAGGSVTLRTADGVHLTPAGAALLAAAVIDAIDGRWHLSLTAPTATTAVGSSSEPATPGLRPRSIWPGGDGR